jgi:hypothetical protein
MTNLLVDYSYTVILLLSGASASVPSRTGGALQWGGRPVRRSRSQKLDPEVSRVCTGFVFGLCVKGTTIWYPNNTRSVVTRLPPFSRAGYSGTERLGDWDQAHTHEGGGPCELIYGCGSLLPFLDPHRGPGSTPPPPRATANRPSTEPADRAVRDREEGLRMAIHWRLRPAFAL